MAKKPYTTTVIQTVSRTVIIWAEDQREALNRAEDLVEQRLLTFESAYEEVFASEAYQTHPSEMDLFDHFDDPN